MKRVVKQAIALSLLLAGVGCKPPDVTAVAPTYVGIWRAGTTPANYMIFELYRDKPLKFFGPKQNTMAPVELNGDVMTFKSPNDGTVKPEEAGVKHVFTIKRISETKIELTDTDGAILGVTTPLQFEKITSDEAEQTDSQIMKRAINGG